LSIINTRKISEKIHRFDFTFARKKPRIKLAFPLANPSFQRRMARTPLSVIPLRRRRAGNATLVIPLRPSPCFSIVFYGNYAISYANSQNLHLTASI
jgi:hypothetical protein